MKLVFVEWEDSNGPHGWRDLRHYRKSTNMTCRSVGWLVQDSEASKTLSPHLSFDEENNPADGDGIIQIPSSAIRKIIELNSELAEG